MCQTYGDDVKPCLKESIVPAFCQLYLLLFVLTSVQTLSDIRNGCTTSASHARIFKHIQKGGAIKINVVFIYFYFASKM
jgi:hypothetical protein